MQDVIWVKCCTVRALPWSLSLVPGVIFILSQGWRVTAAHRLTCGCIRCCCGQIWHFLLAAAASDFETYRFFSEFADCTCSDVASWVQWKSNGRFLAVPVKLNLIHNHLDISCIYLVTVWTPCICAYQIRGLIYGKVLGLVLSVYLFIHGAMYGVLQFF